MEAAVPRRLVKLRASVYLARLLVCSCALVMCACSSSSNSNTQGNESPGPTSTGTNTPLLVSPPATHAEASRFLAQTTFGSTTPGIDEVMRLGYTSWIDQQIELPMTSMLTAFDDAQLANPASAPSRDWIFEAFWRHAVEADDQLRQRMAFALSQIFVISLRDGAVAGSPRGVADFYAMLSDNAFGNFRQLLEDVTLHPMMGAYLSHLGNEKGNPSTGQVPDENFAREIMQLFSIGLYELDADGSVKLDASNQPIETYKTEDVQGLARVFTGFSWNGPDKSIGRFQGWIPEPGRETMPMQAYPEFHSTLEKRFLGQVITGQNTPDTLGDLEIALDTLFKHPNTGVFIGKQLIQRLVSSNPSSAYVQRVASAFADDGNGERGNMAHVVRSILLDTEARDIARTTNPHTGRIREPILRMTHWMRSMNARPGTGEYLMFATDDPATSLGMTALRSPSVFNFYRPGYTPPNTPIADAMLVSPEMQITHETSVAGYLNSMLNAVELGTGSGNSIKSEYTEASALAANPQELVEYLDVLLLHGSMSANLKDLLIQAINTIDVPGQQASEDAVALVKRARLAVYLAFASPEYIVLK